MKPGLNKVKPRPADGPKKPHMGQHTDKMSGVDADRAGPLKKAPKRSDSRSAANSRAGAGGEQYRNRDKFKFAGPPGTGVVTRNELDKWKIHTSKPNATLQDYIDARDGKGQKKLEVPKQGKDGKPIQPDTWEKGKVDEPGSPNTGKKQTSGSSGGASAATVTGSGVKWDNRTAANSRAGAGGANYRKKPADVDEPGSPNTRKADAGPSKKDPKSHGDRLGVTLPPSPHGPKMSRLKHRQLQKQKPHITTKGTAVDQMLRDRNVDYVKDKDGKTVEKIRDKHAANLKIGKKGSYHGPRNVDREGGGVKPKAADTQGTGIPKKITPPPAAKANGKKKPEYDWKHGKTDRMGNKLKYPHGYNQTTGKKLKSLEGGLRMWKGIEVDSRDSAFPKSADESVVDAYAEFISNQLKSGIQKGHVR